MWCSTFRFFSYNLCKIKYIFPAPIRFIINDPKVLRFLLYIFILFTFYIHDHTILQT